MKWFRKRKPVAEPTAEPCPTHGIVIQDPVWRAQHATLDAVEARMRDEENPPTPDESAAMMAMLIAMGPIGMGPRDGRSAVDRYGYNTFTGLRPNAFCARGHLGPYPGCCG